MKKSRLADAVYDYLEEEELTAFLTDLKDIVESGEKRVLDQLNVYQGVKALLFDNLVFTTEQLDETEDAALD